MLITFAVSVDVDNDDAWGADVSRTTLPDSECSCCSLKSDSSARQERVPKGQLPQMQKEGRKRRKTLDMWPKQRAHGQA